MKDLQRDVASRTWIFVTVASCLALVTANLMANHFGVVAAKLLASTGFIGLAISVGALKSRYGKAILLALILSWLGDALLLGTGQFWFLSGLVAFLLAHCVYVFAFSIVGIQRKSFLLALAATALVSIVVYTWLVTYVPDDMRWPVALYTAVISLMVAAAVGARGQGGSTLIPVGALLFYFSDLSVAAGQFVQPNFPNYVWGLPFYYAGQILLASSASAHLAKR